MQSVKRGRADEALSILLDKAVVDGLSLKEYHKWAKAVWAAVESRLIYKWVRPRQAALFPARMLTRSDDQEGLAIFESLRPAETLSTRIGVGGNSRELGHVTDRPDRGNLNFAHDEVREKLRKSRKLLVSLIQILHVSLTRPRMPAAHLT